LMPRIENNVSSYTATGNVTITDIVTPELAQKLLEATLNGKKLEIQWAATGDPKVFEFRIENIVRPANGTDKLELKWDGDPLDIDHDGSKIIDIPGKEQFIVMSTRVETESESYVSIQFSDLLPENSDYSGLVSFDNFSPQSIHSENNILKVYIPEGFNGTATLKIDASLKNKEGKKLGKEFIQLLDFQKINPQVRFAKTGAILPSNSKGLILPFEAVNLKAVDVVIVKIFENNILQFLQENDLSGQDELRRVGKSVLHKTIELNPTKDLNLNQWNNFFLDLNELISPDPGAIYRVYIAFRQEYAVYPCSDKTPFVEKSEEELAAYWEKFNDGYLWDDYDYSDDNYWENRENPCKAAYYGLSKAVAQNILASNLGILAKTYDSSELYVFVNDIRTAQPLSDVTINVYNYQQQLLRTASTNGEGIAIIKDVKDAYFVVAEQQKEKSYLRITDGSSLSLSKFDVEGEALEKGLKTFIYGERSVWRPGDSIYISMMLSEQALPLPLGHPIVFELTNPRSQLVERKVVSKNESNLYTFKTKTADDAPTGLYNLNVKIGGANFSKSLKVETVRPNRLAIDIDFGKKPLSARSDNPIVLNVNWLHGAVGNNLKTVVEVILSDKKTVFKNYANYIFDDPTKAFTGEPQTVFDGNTNSDGKAGFKLNLNTGEQAPGMLNAIFVTKAFEGGGGFSIDKIATDYYPYPSFTGIYTKKSDENYQAMVTDADHTVQIVTLKPDGALETATQYLECKLYKLDESFWYNRYPGSLAYFVQNAQITPIKQGMLTTAGGKASWGIRINQPEWGRYLVLVKNVTTGHSTGEVLYFDWPGWIGRSHGGVGENANILTVVSDKAKYKTGEKIRLTIPSSAGAKALITLETSTKILSTNWIDTKAGQTVYEFEAKAEMAPNVYAHVTVLQPHAMTANDMPIRMYGIVPILVEDPDTHLNPMIGVAAELRPETDYTVKVSEEKGKAMSYTLAVVDEGLLSLTRFKTPNPWNRFYAKEALGIRTWDLYDQVIGAYGGELERLMAVGGDDEISHDDANQNNRFKPVVSFLGPFYLEKGQSKTHKIHMPNYVGAVRVMVVASNKKAFGSAQKQIKVTQPLMVQASLPRVMGPGETLSIPVHVFAMKPSVKQATVTLKTNRLLELVGESTQTVSFDKPGEKILKFEVKVLEATGLAKIKIEAVSGNEKSSSETQLTLRTANPRVSEYEQKALKPGEQWETQYVGIGMDGTNLGTIEASVMPPINLSKRLDYLITYPHGCIEQTTSSVFPQLYLAKFISLNPTQKQEVAKNVQHAIQRIASFQTFSGGFSYWPGDADVNIWGTNYAGHFLIEAQKAGYAVPASMLDKWEKYQNQKARSWSNDGPSSQQEQSYRLYTLALLGKAEKGSMNKLRESSKISKIAKWQLALAFYVSGKSSTATKLLANLGTQIDPYSELNGTFGSDLRDKAMILEALSAMKNQAEAQPILKEISNRLSTNSWYSTQTTAYCLLAVSKYMEAYPPADKPKAILTDGASSINLSSTANMLSYKIPQGDRNRKLNLKNSSSGTLYVSLNRSGVPAPGRETSDASQLKIEVRYLNSKGELISPELLTQGTDFVAMVTVSNPTNRYLEQLALTQIVPSGWEIINTRLLELPNTPKTAVADYEDFRDDRVNQYFSLTAGQSKRFAIKLNASYTGRYYLPAVNCEAMYNADIYARQKGLWVEVR
ncbi:MAG: hypothetical protein RIS47_580, partial [Bacteroidota bacterium]